MQNTYDLAIIGSGAAAFAAAARAVGLGKSVVMVERGTIGGSCVNTGCVPSKALIAAAEARHTAAEATARFPGITTSASPADMPALIDGKQDLVDAQRAEKYVDIADFYGWDMVPGDAAFAGTPDVPTLRVASREGNVATIEADAYLVATGSRAWIPPIEGLEKAGYLTSTTAMELTELPESLLVLGGGYVALEQAQLFARLGSKVTLLARSRLASREEPEVAQTLQKVFADEDIRVLRRAVALRVAREAPDGQAVVTAEVAGRTQEFPTDRVLVALGRRPATCGLALDTVGVETGEAGEVVVTDRLRSSNPRIWAAGDVTGHPQFVYVAAREGAVAAGNALAGADEHMAFTGLPRVIFTSPAVGTVGLTEKETVAAGIRCTCSVLPLSHVPRALVNRDIRGFIKIVANVDTGEIVGLTAVSEGAGELAAEGVHLLGKSITEVADAWVPYLTMAEGIRIAAKAFTTDVSKLSCCA
ncbi:MAG TPA: mercury(II) reductase [Microbacteriaceae bacterium]|nr:mercury(II) reductase [Microbacteriaceae bacterium]